MKTSIAAWLAVLLGTLWLGQAPAQTQSQPDSPARSADSVRDPAQETRLKQLSEELRCLVCQNQSLADSNAELAVDLRNQVPDQIMNSAILIIKIHLTIDDDRLCIIA